MAVSIVAAFSEVLGVFSVLPFLAVAGNASVLEQQPSLSKLASWLGVNSHREFLVASGIGTIICIVLSNFIAALALSFRIWVCERIISGLSDRLFRGYLAQRYAFFLTRNTAVLGKDLLSELWRLNASLMDPATVFISRGLVMVFVMGALFVYDWKVTAAVAVVVGGFYGAVFWIVKRRLDYLGQLRHRVDEERFRLVSEALGGIKETRIFSLEASYSQAYAKMLRLIANANTRAFLYGALPRYLLETVAFSLLVLVVVVFVARGDSVGDLLPILGLYAVAGVRLMPAMQLVYQASSQLQSGGHALAAVRRLFVELGTVPESFAVPQSFAPWPMRQSLRVEKAHFRYADAKRWALQSVSLEIPVGACVGIAGPSGSGKTTLADLCLGLLQPETGRILVDGEAITDCNRARWMRSVGYVPQQIYLCDGTVLDNIAFGELSGKPDLARASEAARLANLHDFIVGQLPQGYDTPVGERGVRLSGGQRQRLAIARALYRDPSILLFDEATSALDTETEEAIVDSIQRLAHRKTIILIAHRMTTLRHCDVIHVLNEGVVERSISYEDLLRQSS